MKYDDKSLRNLMAKTSLPRSGEYLAGEAAANNLERVAT